MRGRTIRRALEGRMLQEQSAQIGEELQAISLGSKRIEPKSVLRAATLERAVGDWFLKALPRQARTPGEATALSPLIKRLSDLHDEQEVRRLSALDIDPYWDKE